MTNSSLWWWALPVLLLPILWHRKKREQRTSLLLASARFLPAAEPKQQRVWRFSDPLLLLLRCLLLATLIALLADLVLAWRGDAVLVVPGSVPGQVDRAAAAAGFGKAERIALPDRDAVRWLHAHEREFKPAARLLVVGDAAMPATLPRFRHAVTLRTAVPPTLPVERHVAVFSTRAEAWRRLFAAANESWRIVVDPQPGPRTDLIVWDRPEAPPAALHAPLWWVGDVRAFPALHMKAGHPGAQGYLVNLDGGPPTDADAARALFADWQRRFIGVQPYTAPALALVQDTAAPAGPASGALHDWLGIALVGLFALERIATHARRR
jgi:hypothetical protein